MCWILGSWWVILFGKAVELLGGTFLGEGDQQRWALRVYRLLPLLVHSLLTNCSWNGISQAPNPATVPSPPWWTMSLQTASQTLLPLNCLLLGVLLQELEQKLKQLGNQIFFCDVAELRSLKEGAERKNLSLYPMLANGILGDLSYSNKNWRKKSKRFCCCLKKWA